ncbi:PIR Superfamily Protein [Plasmodium ovale wallikeri]|uniref:PIR protein n=2 Tax=Plasmodium ovale TaxID=36330 RepID=A0A1C3KIC4_PLAOA|nr:PIR Superfamily Protein [Plasmodium ovale wallikeri]SBT73537.1 PIR protein [Plasmodium ovale]
MEASGQNERYDSFDEYSSNKDIYERIRSEIGGDDYDSFPSGVLQEKEVNIDFIKKDCLKLRRYLINFNTKENCIKKNCCQYINYFLNNMIRDHYNSDTSIFNIYKTYINHGSNNYIKSLCASEINYMEINKYEKTKNLYITYDLYKIFMSNKYGNLCSQANSCAKTYNNLKTLYPELNDTKFCRALIDFKKVFETNEHISKGKCDSEIENLLSYPDSCNKLLQESNKMTLSSGHEAPVLEAQVESAGQVHLPKGDKIDEIPDDNTIPSGSLGSALPITLFSSGISVLLILLSLYKFTPLGHWLRLQTQRFNGVSEQFDGEQYEIQQHNSEFEEQNTEYDGYNITYSSL